MRLASIFPKAWEDRWALWLLMGISLLLKGLMASFMEVVNVDGALYISVAQEIALGNFQKALSLFPMPFYPLLVTAFHFLIPDWQTAALVISVGCSVLVLVPLYRIAEHLFHHQAALWCCAAWVVCPEANEWAVEIMRDPPFLLLFAWTVFLALRATESPKLRFFLGVALLLGFCSMLRIEALIFYPFFLAWFALQALGRPSERKGLLGGILLWGVIFLALGAALLIWLGPEWKSFNRLGQVAGDLREFFTFQFLERYRFIYEQLKVFQRQLPYPDGPQNFLEIARHYMPLIYFIGFTESFLSFLFAPFLLPLAAGIKGSTIRRDHLLVLLTAALYLLVVFYRHIDMNFITQRYFLTPAFLLFPWIGAGMPRLVAFFQGRRAKILYACAGIALFAIIPLYKSVKPSLEKETVVRRAGEWIARHPRLQGARIMTTDGRIPFYAGRRRDFLDYGGQILPSELEKLALSHGIDLIVVRRSLKDKHTLPELQNYGKLKEFTGRKDVIVVYATEEMKGSS